MIKTGPSRFILINAGQYGYGEIVVDKPVQLVGANNVGKTTLINALQFLLIDDEKQMRFPKALKETKRFYFPDTYSYVLLEIITPTGYRVLGAHGMGPIKSNNFERFAFEGEFQKEVFIKKDNTVRDFESIKADLVANSFTMLEPRHLKAALTGVGENKGVFLGLVPLRDSNHYASFQAVFKNLLHLNNLRQDELKEVLLKVYKNSFSLEHIDLTGSYGTRFREILKQRESIRLLSSVKPMVEDVAEHITQHLKIQKILPSLYAVIEKKLLADERKHMAKMESRDRQLAEFGGKKRNLQIKADELQGKKDTCNIEMGGVEKDIIKVHALQKLFSSFSLEITKTSLAMQEEEVSDLGARLQTATGDDPRRLKERIGKKLGIIEKNQRLLEQSQDLLITHLRDQFSDHQVDRLFTLLNPEMLGLVQGEDGFVIKERALLEQRLNTLLKSMDHQGHYLDDSVQIMLKTMKSPGAAEFTDPKRITEDLCEGKRERAELEQRLEAAENASALKLKKKKLVAANQVLQKQLFEYQVFLGKQKLMPEWETSKKNLEKKLAQLGRDMAENRILFEELEKKTRKTFLEKQEADRLFKNVVGAVQALKPPSLEWEKVDLPDLEAKAMEELMQEFRDHSREEETLSRKIENIVHKIDLETSGRYSQGNEKETVDYLFEQLEGLEEKDKANSHDWHDLVAGFGNSFKELYASYETFKSKITALNRQLGKVSISNLSKLQVEVADDHKWVRKIKQIAIYQESPLFADIDAQKEIYSEFSEILKDIPNLHLRDLFTLHFVVETPDGNVTTYPNFDAIESNGTTITIKILVNLILLKVLFGGKAFRIPYYLDEAPNLSSKNLLAILQVSKALGFTPILAGTIAVDAADVLYFMNQNKGKIWMRPHFRMEIQRAMAGDA